MLERSCTWSTEKKQRQMATAKETKLQQFGAYRCNKTTTGETVQQNLYQIATTLYNRLMNCPIAEFRRNFWK